MDTKGEKAAASTYSVSVMQFIAKYDYAKYFMIDNVIYVCANTANVLMYILIEQPVLCVCVCVCVCVHVYVCVCVCVCVCVHAASTCVCLLTFYNENSLSYS